MQRYKNIIENSDSTFATVVEEFTSNKGKLQDYQSEHVLEKNLVKQLLTLGYERLIITSPNCLLENIKIQLEKVNNFSFSDNEWELFKQAYLINPTESIVQKTKKIQEDYILALKRDDNSTKNVRLIDKTNIHNNILQVINQYEATGTRKNIYDVTLLVNGLPLVHIELKRRGRSIKDAFYQIERYSKESFWSAHGLFEYIQIFVISNGTHTKYYSNTTRELACKEASGANNNQKRTSNSFEFTSYWADASNKPIEDLEDFTATFLSKHTLLNVITKYCVFTVDDMLLVMRPYQIVATEKIVNKINWNLNNKQNIGTINAGGFIWHTTGSGKTLTSFKTARIASSVESISKVIFIVDRKDLDYQTMREYNKFEEGAANSNSSTAVLKKQLEDPNVKIIITTIQKLSIFISKNKKHNIFTENIVLIFDECHRSQFGTMHKEITKAFKKYMIFGFTGTPIFASNTTTHNKFPNQKTTQQVFGDALHKYTIVDAIQDGNVLKFRIDYVATVKLKDVSDEEEVYDIKREKALLAPKRIEGVTKYILEHFNQKTKRNDKSFTFSKVVNVAEVAKQPTRVMEEKIKTNITGFNSIFATASIEAAKLYYTEFNKQQKELPENLKLKVATIFSWNPNEDDFDNDGLFEENNEDTSKLDKSSRDFLDLAIADYNKMFGTNYDTSSEKFQNYYKDLSLRVKNREIDLLIVVNMFLTGFDATTLNTLWVDKRLKQQGLIQAFSRTNRILNSVKTYGNIVCFRKLEKQVQEAISIFGNKNASGIVLMKSFNEYFYGYEYFEGYEKLVQILTNKYPLGEQILGEELEKSFIRLYNKILKVKNILQSFDEFEDNQILADFDFQNYHGEYLRIYDKYRKENKADKDDIVDDLEFEIELVKSVEVNIDYILMLVAEYKEENSKNKEILINISKSIESSPTLRNKKELIMRFIESVNDTSDIVGEWDKYIKKSRQEELDKIIEEENLDPIKIQSFIENSFRNGEIKDFGTDVVELLPPLSRFGQKVMGTLKREFIIQRVIDKLKAFFDKFFGI